MGLFRRAEQYANRKSARELEKIRKQGEREPRFDREAERQRQAEAAARFKQRSAESDQGQSWYRVGTMVPMAMNLRLSDAESDALRAKADEEGRSMQDVARTAIAHYVSERPQRLRGAIERVRDEDRELLERLAQ